MKLEVYTTQPTEQHLQQQAKNTQANNYYINNQSEICCNRFRGNKSPVYTNIYTIDKTAPKVVSTIPKNGATGVSTTSTITIKLSENLKTSINWSKIYMKNLTSGKLVAIKTSINGNEINIKMVKTRYTNNLYEVYIPTGAVKDNAGNNLGTSYYLKFKTV